MKDLPQSFSLSRIRPFADDGLLRAVTLGDLTRPVHEHSPVQAFEIRVVEVSLLDVAAHHRLAVPIGCLRTELARAAPGAVAIRELRTTNHPSINHRNLSVSRMFWTVHPVGGNRVRDLLAWAHKVVSGATPTTEVQVI
jgi:hypothetical protein